MHLRLLPGSTLLQQRSSSLLSHGQTKRCHRRGRQHGLQLERQQLGLNGTVAASSAAASVQCAPVAAPSVAQQLLLDQHGKQQQAGRWRCNNTKQQRREQHREQLWHKNRGIASIVEDIDSFTSHELAAAAAAISTLQDNEPYVPAQSAAGRDRQLTAHIAKRKHWTQLQLIWLDNSTNFSPIHLTATITKLAKLAESQGVTAADRPELFKFSSAIMSSIHLLLGALDQRGTAQCLWAYAKLQSVAPHRSRSGDLAADALVDVLLRQHMAQLRPEELSQVAWATAVLQPAGLTLPEQWWVSLQDRLLLVLPDVQPAEVACIAWATAKLHATPSDATIAAVMQHLESRSAEYGAKELLQLLMAAAAWQYKQTAAWRDCCFERLQQLVPTMVAQDVSQCLLALAKLQLQPPRQLAHSLLLQLQPLLPKLEASASLEVLVTAPYALAKLHLNPGPDWWAGFLPYTAVALQSLNPAGLAVLAWSVAKQGLNPGKPWIAELILHSGYKLRAFAAQELSMLAWSLGKWETAPPAWWRERFEQVSVDRAADFTAAELSALLLGASGMHVTSSTVTATAVDSAFNLQDQPMHQQHCSYSRPWIEQMLDTAHENISGAPIACLAGIFSGLARLSVRPSLTWLSDFEAAVVAALPQAETAADIRSIAAILWSYAVLGIQPSWELFGKLNSQLCNMLQNSSNRLRAGPSAANAVASATALSPKAASQLVWSLLNLPVPESAPWIDDLLVAVAPTIHQAGCTSVLVMLLWGLGKLGHRPGLPGWLDLWWDACAVQLQNDLAKSGSCCMSTGGTPTAVELHSQEEKTASRLATGTDCMTESSSSSLSMITAVLWSFTALHQTPSNEAWLTVVLQAAKPLLPTASGHAFASLLQQLVRVRVWPGEAWLDAAADVLLSKWQQQQGEERAVLLKALAYLLKLGFVPSGEVARQLRVLVVAGK